MEASSTPQKPAGTRYVVLGSADEGGWLEAYRAIASSGEAAIREYVERLDGAPVAKQFVAIPERSFQPVTVTVERKTVVKLG